MPKRDELITDLLLKMAMDENLPAEKRAEIALALQSDKARREADQHEIRILKIKSKPEAKRSVVEKRDLAHEEPVVVPSVPLGQQVNSILEDLRSGSETEVQKAEGVANG